MTIPSEVIRVKVSKEEKEQIEKDAKRHGFEDYSRFMMFLCKKYGTKEQLQS